MSVATRLLLLAALIVASLVLACGGDDEGDSTETPTGTATRTRTPTRTSGSSPTNDDLKSPANDEPNGGVPTVTPDIGPQPTPAPEGTPAVAPPDQTAYLDQFKGKTITQETCAYNPTTYVVDCPDRGKFAIDPVLGGQDISCTIGIVDGNPKYVQCQSVEPRQSIYYEIRA